MALSSQPPRTPVVAVTTVSYRSGEVLEGFLQSVPASSAAPLLVVVADNDSNDPVVAKLTAASSAHYLPLSRNLGYGGAMNEAIRSLPSDVRWVLVSNPDVVLTPGAIDALVAAGESDPRIAAVGPAIITDGEVYPSARAVPSLRTGIGHALFANIWLGNPWTRAYRRDSSSDPVRRDAGWLSGACVLVRKSAFDELSGFDDGYFMYFEDVDLGYRLGKAGYRNVYEPAAVVVHSGAHSTSDHSAQMIAVHHQSARRFLTRKYSGWYLWPVRVALIIGLDLRSAFLSRRATHH
ncbi:glycosyltransferase family 2 protein [Lacisediminihabitans sp. H27-G8]|uniref:glycosyltransferase family 2 protein n=1 Tax=Lacisediminihabitans sp. H27-G8 TaxID=3111909 RepID=UPI0038FCF3C6